MKIIFNTIILYILFTVNALAMTEKEFFKDEQYINKIIDYAILTEKLDGARGCINESLQLLNEAKKSNDKTQRETFGITGYILWIKPTDTIFKLGNDSIAQQYQKGPYIELYGYINLLNISEEQDNLILKKLFNKFKEKDINSK